jgi:hypothetical protein
MGAEDKMNPGTYERTPAIREKQRKAMAGKIVDNRGLYLRTPEVREKQRLSMLGQGLGKKRPGHSRRMTGEGNPNWGKKRTAEARKKQSLTRLKKTKGFSYTVNGYVQLPAFDHPRAQAGRMLEHRLVVERMLGRYLSPREEVHHRNRVKDDNRPENLMAFINHSAHRLFELGKPVKPGDIIFDGRTCRT